MKTYPAPAVAWTLLFTLFCGSILNTLDRGILSFLVEPMRRDLHISDVQISLLQGFSFSIFYVLAGLPLGYLADRVARARLLAAGLALWSAATILVGCAPGFGWVFAARMVVGCGEATLGPCSLSLIADSFAAARRGRAMSLYLLGGAMATGLAALLAGFVLSGGLNFVPGVAGVAGWRVALVLAGGLGAIVSVALAAQREPARQGVTVRAASGQAGWRAVLRYLVANAAVFWPFYAGFALFSIAVYGVLSWAASLLIRQFGVAPSAVGHVFGLMFMVAGGAGALLSGQILNGKLFQRRRLAKLTLLAALPLVMLPAAAAMFAPTVFVATAMVALMILIGPAMTIVSLCALAEMMPNDVRAFSVSLLGISGTMLGGGFGPLLVAECTQHIYHADRLVGLSILTVGVPCLLAASACYWASRAALRRSLAANTPLAAVIEADFSA